MSPAGTAELFATISMISFRLLFFRPLRELHFDICLDARLVPRVTVELIRNRLRQQAGKLRKKPGRWRSRFCTDALAYARATARLAYLDHVSGATIFVNMSAKFQPLRSMPPSGAWKSVKFKRASKKFRQSKGATTRAARAGPRSAPGTDCITSNAEPFDRILQNAGAAIELIDGNKLSGAMRDADVTGAKDDRVRAECNHARRFSSKGDGSGCLFRAFLEELNQF